MLSMCLPFTRSGSPSYSELIKYMTESAAVSLPLDVSGHITVSRITSGTQSSFVSLAFSTPFRVVLTHLFYLLEHVTI